MTYVGINRPPRIAPETWLYCAWLLIAGFLALGLIVQTDRLGACWAAMEVPK